MGDRYGERLRFVHANSYQLGHQPGNNLKAILNDVNPDLMTFPADAQEIGKLLIPVSQYQQYCPAPSYNTVLLYKTGRITVKENQDIPFSSFPGVNVEKMLCPEVKMYYKGARDPSRVFTLITWDYKMTVSSQTNRVQSTQGIIAFAQALASVRQQPVLLSGEFDLDADTVEKILKYMNGEKEETFLNGIKDLFDPNFLPSMVNGSTREFRRMFKLGMHKAGSSQYFLSSKDLKFDAPMILPDGAMNGQTDMPSPKPFIGPERPPHMQKPQSVPKPATQRPIQADLHMRPPQARNSGG